MLVLERTMGLGTILADANHANSEAIENLDAVAVVTQLARAHRRVVPRIEHQQEHLTTMTPERKQLAVFVFQ